MTPLIVDIKSDDWPFISLRLNGSIFWKNLSRRLLRCNSIDILIRKNYVITHMDPVWIWEWFFAVWIVGNCWKFFVSSTGFTFSSRNLIFSIFVMALTNCDLSLKILNKFFVESIFFSVFFHCNSRRKYSEMFIGRRSCVLPCKLVRSMYDNLFQKAHCFNRKHLYFWGHSMDSSNS